MQQTSLDRLVAALRDPVRYAHPVDRVEVLETHASYVLLAGAYAYKIKKPVKLGFLDFSTLEARRLYCEEELRLNRRTAPQLYLDLVVIAGSDSAPVMGGEGPAIEYAVRMSRFPQEALLDRIARRGDLSPQHMDVLARSTAEFHARIARASPDGSFGTAAQVLAPATQNFEQMLGMVEDPSDTARLRRLREWTGREHAALCDAFEQRRRQGFIRECHGDLHLGNIALLDGVPTPFDGIEFNESFRWTDMMSEIAFLTMDLLDHRLPAAAFRFLNGYLEVTGDYAGVRVLRFYLVYRALVRAKVSCIRAHQPQVRGDEKQRTMREYRGHLQLAERLGEALHGGLVLMHGLSGSGKSVFSQELLESLGAIRLRSDVERKRLHGLEAGARTGSGIDSGIYALAATAQTYARLGALACELLAARHMVVVDAAFLQRRLRDDFSALARKFAVPMVLASCHAPAPVLRDRLSRRERRGDDASEAGLAVLERQLATEQPLGEDEIAYTVAIDSAAPLKSRADAAAAILQLLGGKSTRQVWARTDGGAADFRDSG